MEIACAPRVFPFYNRASGFPEQPEFHPNEGLFELTLSRTSSPSSFGHTEVTKVPQFPSEWNARTWGGYRQKLLAAFSDLVDRRIEYLNGLEHNSWMLERGYVTPNAKVIGCAKETIERIRIMTNSCAVLEGTVLPVDFLPIFVFGIIDGGGVGLEVRVRKGITLYASFYNFREPEVVFEENGISQEIECSELTVVDCILNLYGYGRR